MITPVLSVEHLGVRFSEKSASRYLLKDIHFQINEGKTLALVGESGSGKSITARAIMQLLDARIFQTEGIINLRKKDGRILNLVGSLDKDIQFRGHEAGMIFQEPMTALNPVMPIGRQLTETICAHQKIRKPDAIQKAISWLQMVQLPDPTGLMLKYPHQLSGGQKQRVMIAMAMSSEPSLLIADEPTTALDTTTQKEILALLKALQKKTGMAMLFITHDLGIVKEIADDVAVMHEGNIIEYNTQKKLFEAPQHAFTRMLMQCRAAGYTKGEKIPVDELFQENIHQIIEPLPATNTTYSTPASVLEIKSLSVTYYGKRSFLSKHTQDFEALKNLDLHILRGETVGLVGESGCGKTTLSRVLLGLTPFQSGSINMEGETYDKETYAAKKDRYKTVQVVFQDPYSSLNPRIKVGEMIAEPLMVHHRFHKRETARAYIIDLLEKVYLSSDFYERYPHQLSGGQRQRLVIARALALQPALIIWDESVSALDVRLQAQMLNLLNDLKSKYHFSSLFISHDLSVIKYISDRMYVMQQGSIVESGIPEEIWRRPEHPCTQRLLDAIV